MANNTTQQIVNRAWSFAHVLRDDGLSYMQDWLALEADVKGDIYEGLLAKSAAESPKGAGQYFTPRELIWTSSGSGTRASRIRRTCPSPMCWRRRSPTTCRLRWSNSRQSPLS